MSLAVCDTHAMRQHLDGLAGPFEEALKEYVARAGADPVANLHDGMAYALGTDIEDAALRGKRIRPLLCLLTCEALGTPAKSALPFALAIELMHNFALVHDDIQDGDVMRRGRDSAWVKYGAPHAINIGDYLLVHAYRVLSGPDVAHLSAEVRLRLVELIGSALDHTHVGQALEMNYRGTPAFTQAEYLRIVREKTGYYLAAPIQGGAVVAGASEEVLARIGAMAQLLGPLFQIIDDIIDLTDGKGRDSIGSDIREGKRSFLVAHTAERCTPEEREWLFGVLDMPRGRTTHESIMRVIELFECYDAIEAGRAYCQKLHEESKRELAALPPDLAKPLGMVFEMLVGRNK